MFLSRCISKNSDFRGYAKEIETAKGSAPQNAISIQQVRQGTVYTRIPLKAAMCYQRAIQD